MMVLLVISIFASIIKGIGNILNNIGTVMTPGNGIDLDTTIGGSGGTGNNKNLT
jgi:hypothetical protein